MRILPALIAEPLGGMALVLDEPIAIGIAILLDPPERSPQRCLKFSNEPKILHPTIDSTQDQDEQERRIDRAVVGCVRNLTRARHLTRPELMQNLARFFITPAIDFSPLVVRQELQC